MPRLFKISHYVISALLLFACSDSEKSTVPDISAIAEIDQAYFMKSYEICSINNSLYDCNCVARANVGHRNNHFDQYKAEYDTIHKPALEAEIEALGHNLEQDSKNSADERQIESMELKLEDLREKLSLGINSVNNYNPPALPGSATEQCIIR